MIGLVFGWLVTFVCVLLGELATAIAVGLSSFTYYIPSDCSIDVSLVALRSRRTVAFTEPELT